MIRYPFGQSPNMILNIVSAVPLAPGRHLVEIAHDHQNKLNTLMQDDGNRKHQICVVRTSLQKHGHILRAAIEISPLSVIQIYRQLCRHHQ
eukprot:1113845-Rhodomonas_salina.1